MQKSRIAIIKPDHLGDLVLASPAIHALCSRYSDVNLFCNPATVSLARFLFPGLPVHAINFPHLAKSQGQNGYQNLSIADEFEFLVFLRQDAFVGPSLRSSPSQKYLTPRTNFYVHDTALHKEVISRLAGFYSRSEHFFRYREVPQPEARPRAVGLCISAGFGANKWPKRNWLELARLLVSEGIEVIWIGGPAEAKEVALLQYLFARPTKVIIGNSDFGAFLEKMTTLDLVIATDSGTAHLCSLVVPVLSIFGPSPFRRYAPFGRMNRVLTQDLSCSPCSQFDKNGLNLCVSRECINGITAEAVMDAIHRKPKPPGFDPAPPARGLKLVWGTSHQSWRPGHLVPIASVSSD